jgi:hypothetical protein
LSDASRAGETLDCPATQALAEAQAQAAKMQALLLEQATAGRSGQDRAGEKSKGE